MFFFFFYFFFFFLIFFFFFIFFSYIFLLLFFSFSFIFVFYVLFFTFFSFFSFFSFLRSSEKGTRLRRTPNLQNQGSARSVLQTCQTEVRPCLFSELPACQDSEFWERNWPFSELQTCWTRFWPTSNLELRTCQGSEFVERNWPSSEPAKSGLYLFFLRTPNLLHQGYTHFYLKLRTKASNSGQKHNLGPSCIIIVIHSTL